MIAWIVNRLREPSSWAGLGSLAVAIGVSHEQWLAIAQIGAGIAGLAAVAMAENKDRKDAA